MIRAPAGAAWPGYAQAAERVLDSVVQVRAGEGRADMRQGSGVVWNRTADGGVLVVSNAHVTDRMPLRVVSSAGSGYAAALLCSDAARDLSVVYVANGGDDLVPARHAAGPRLRVGELVVAVGHPFGVRNAVSTGVVHAVGPLIVDAALPSPQRDQEWVQVDVRLGPGNSGGPLVNAEGNVVGISTMIVGGLALGVPRDAVDEFMAAALARVSVR